MIDVYFTPTPNGHKVSIMLEEIGLPHRLLKMDMLAGDHLTPEYRRINPNGRLPAIVDHDPIGGGAPLPIFESGAILLYLAEKSGQFLPTDPRRRSQAQRSEEHTSELQSLMRISYAVFCLKKKKQNK